MAQATFHAPRRKRRVYECYESPFPIPLSHDSYPKVFRICQAEIINNFVIVRNVEEIELLYGKGYFGKGILSRSRPEYNIAEQPLLAKWKASKVKLPVITYRKYQRHVEWARALLEEQGLSDNILEDYIKPIALPTEEENINECPTSPCKDRTVVEGNPTYDPLAKYGSGPSDTEDVLEEPGRETLEKMYCHKHDDFIVHCGCKPERPNVQRESVSTGIEDPDHEYVLVVEEEECDVDMENGDPTGNVVTKKKLVCRRNPFKIFEYLQLSREEAFFLVYALGCLTVNYNKEPLTILKLWEVFSASQPNFQTTYIAYHHFRSKGWVPKVGLKYGTDLLLYRKGPPFYHASYSVIVELVDEKFGGSPLRPLTWTSLAGLNRTTVNVSKELLFCYLIKSPDFTERDLASPGCIKKMKVQELIASRWISSRERMEKDEI